MPRLQTLTKPRWTPFVQLLPHSLFLLLTDYQASESHMDVDAEMGTTSLTTPTTAPPAELPQGLLSCLYTNHPTNKNNPVTAAGPSSAHREGFREIAVKVCGTVGLIVCTFSLPGPHRFISVDRRRTRGYTSDVLRCLSR